MNARNFEWLIHLLPRLLKPDPKPQPIGRRLRFMRPPASSLAQTEELARLGHRYRPGTGRARDIIPRARNVCRRLEEPAGRPGEGHSVAIARNLELCPDWNDFARGQNCGW